MTNPRVVLHTRNAFVVFDLDDTLYREIDYLRSGYAHVVDTMLPGLPNDIVDSMLRRWRARENVFEWLTETYSRHYPGLSASSLLRAYRTHEPAISLPEETKAFLGILKARGVPAGLITDGRSISQRAKLTSLGLADYFADVLISEEFGTAKPNPANFLHFEKKYPGKTFWYIGDRVPKDFTAPAQLGWNTVCLRDGGANIHPQSLDHADCPRHVIGSFSELHII